MTPPVRCPALLIAAPGSGQGKTAFTAGLALALTRRGYRTAVLKLGPDYLDPQILSRASGQSVYQLDPWMMGEDACVALLHRQAANHDIVLVESAMGLYDGQPSAAEVAARFQLPVLLLIDAARMAQTFAAVARGLQTFRSDLNWFGVVANHTAGERHVELLAEKLPADLPLLAALPRLHPDTALPSRHLGLVQAAEIDDLDQRLQAMTEAIESSGLLARWRPPQVLFPPPVEGDFYSRAPALLKNRVIGVARDEAFSFIYPQNLECLQAMGAELVFFSPLHDRRPPAADALYLPGGYPELHLQELAANRTMRDALRAYHHRKTPMLAECGGFLYCLERLTHTDQTAAPLLGLLPGSGRMQSRLAALGMEEIHLPTGELRGHSFHHCKVESPARPGGYAVKQAKNRRGEPWYYQNGLFASFLHFHFAGNPPAAASLFNGEMPVLRC